MPVTFRAAIAHGAHLPLTIETLEYADPKGREVLVRLEATGLCHSDLHILDGSLPARFPTILGHEGGGVVVACGPDVQSIALGDHVVPLFLPDCGECANCTSGKTNLCLRFSMYGGSDVTLPTWNGEPIAKTGNLGTFAEYLIVHDYELAKVRRDAPLDKIFYTGCGVTTGVGASMFAADVKQGDKVVIFGLGGIGLNALQGARLAGAGMIIGVDTNPARQAAAERFGATHFVDPAAIEGDLVEYLRDLTGGGADHCIECVGNTKLMKIASDALNPAWGVLTIVGTAAYGQEVSASPFDFQLGRTWQGTLFGGAKGKTDVPRIVDWYMDGDLIIDDLITHEVSLENINEGFELMKRGESIRTVIRFAHA
jgi:S-(hydroxymethyl)glutathione dehydrogenase/alcohol dehydrogenase